MKTITLLLLLVSTFCALQYQNLEPVSRGSDITENKKNGDFTVCTHCLRDEECRNYIYDEILKDLTDDYDKEATALQVCLSLSGNQEFDEVIADYLGRNNAPLYSRKSKIINNNQPRNRFDIVEEEAVRLKAITPQGVLIHVLIHIIIHVLRKYL